ncbi:hypothetical protein [Clostridium sp. B9]|uniref:hypothetical protein n=1 Tax=Clostridium sp. B9 TaxID=3423224 RepID=UPI003D2F1153
MSLEKQRDLWVLGIIYFFIGMVIFTIKGSYLGLISILAVIIVSLNVLKVNKELRTKELKNIE